MIFSIILPIFFMLPTISANDCRDSPVTSDGTFPPGATDLTPLPYGYQCELKFQIPDGFIVQFKTKAIIPPNNQKAIEVYLFAANQIYSIPSGQSTSYAPATSASLNIETVTGGVQIYVEYTFFDVRTYHQTVMQTGQFLQLAPSLGTWSPTEYVTFNAEQDEVALAVASSFPSDPTAQFTFVYDGSDITAPCVGTLYAFANAKPMKKSTNQNLTIANFYGSNYGAYVVANDYSKVEIFNSYQLVISTSKVPTKISASDDTGRYAAYTVICDGCDSNYIDSLYFYSSDGDESLDFIPMTPSYSKMAVLSFKHDSYQKNQFPHQIPAKMFSFVVKSASVDLTLNAGLAKSWIVPAANRKIVINSRSMWNPAETPAFNYRFESDTTFNYTLTDVSLIIQSAGEKLRLQIGTPGKTNNLLKEFGCDNPTDTCVKSEYTPTMAPGTYSTLGYIGSNSQSYVAATILINNLKT